MTWKVMATAAVLLSTTAARAQSEELILPFVDTEAAFEEAARSGKRVLVYQDWPG